MNLSRSLLRWPTIGAAVASLLASSFSAQQDGPAAELSLDAGDAVFWTPLVDYDHMVLTVAGPDGLHWKQRFAAGTAPAFDLLRPNGQPLADGGYTFQLETVPFLEPWVRDALRQAREHGEQETVLPQLRAAGALSVAPEIQTGHFHVSNGRLVQDEHEEDAGQPSSSARGTGGGAPSAQGAGQRPTGGNTATDFLINENLYVIGSACIGFDCVNNSAFGFDTVRLEENNLRILFRDTSNSASFPTVDWQLTANDSTNGGANRFSIEDLSTGRVPFTIRDSAPSHSLYVDQQGDVGLGTSVPALNLHVVDGNTPSMRFEQNTSVGFSAQSWDVAANESNFFVRDVTNGSRLPFRIRPGAPTSSIEIASTGRVGLGTSSPATALHVRGAGARTGLRVEDVSAGAAPRIMLDMVNNGAVGVGMTDTSAPALANPTWYMGTVRYPNMVSSPNGSFQVALGLSSRLVLEENGDLTVTGTVTGLSDRDAKTDLESVDVQDVLERVAALELATWRFKDDVKSARHLGPMAQDFHEQFGLGADERHISFVDSDGVALAAIQALFARTLEKDATIEQLTERNRELEERLSALEGRMNAVLATLELGDTR